MTTSKTLATLVTIGLLIATGAAVQAGTITPSFAYGTQASYGSPANLINGVGLSGVGDILTQTHASNHTTGWLKNNVNPANELVFGWFGETANLTGLHAWQYEQAGCCNGRGVNTFDVSFSTDFGGTYSAPISLSLDSSLVVPGDETVQTRAFPMQTGVTNVKFTNMTDFPTLPSPGWQGLNEVRFEGTVSPELGHFGNTLSSRATASDDDPQLLWSNMYGAPVAGSVDSVEVFFQGSTNTFELFQLRPTGTANQFDVIASSGVITPDTSRSMTLPNGPFDLEKGDILFHYGRGLPFSTDLLQPTAHNNQNIFWPSPSAPGVGTPVTLGTGGFPLNAIRRDYAWAVQLDGFVETVGNGAGPAGPPDGSPSILVVMDNDPFTQPGRIDTWQFFNDTAGTGGRDITPVTLRETANGLEVLGIGITRVGTENGFQQYDFATIEGTNVVAAGDLFGFYYGDSQGGNQGSVEYTQIGSDNIRLFTQFLGDGLQITDVFTSPNWNLARYYSANASTLVVPEPGSLALLALGGIALIGYLLRRRRG